VSRFRELYFASKEQGWSKNWWGVCIYIKKSIDSYSLNESDFGFTDSTIETVWCCCWVNNEKLLLGCIYRSGDASEIANEEINNVFIKANELKRGNFRVY
jgi:hypothetical protein